MKTQLIHGGLLFSLLLPAMGGEIHGLWMMGQSLCEGAESVPIVTLKDTGHGNLSFKRGVRTWIARDHAGKPAGRPEEDFEFVPLVASTYGGLGETIANGMADHLAQATSKRYLVAYAGQGGRTIAELSKADESTDPRTPEVKFGEGGFYRTSLDDARRAVNEAKRRGDTFQITALIWMQGEANGGPTGGLFPSRWLPELPRREALIWYRDRLMEYRKQWSDDLRAITGQKDEIPMFTYQTAGTSGAAQLMAAELDPHIHMVGPHYMTPSAVNSKREAGYGAAIHLSADAQRWYGEQVGKVIHRVLANGEAWEPVRPKSARVEKDRASVLVDFHVPRPPLVLDDAFFPRQQRVAEGGYLVLHGFEVRGPGSAYQWIKDVKVEGTTQVRIHLVSPLPEKTRFYLSYGHPAAGELGTVKESRPGEATTELVLSAPFPDRLQALRTEGAFYIANFEPGDAFAQAPVRHVEGATLRYENRELRGTKGFAVGQTLVASRPFSYGNLRDSDPEPALYPFGDATYGTRAGTPYPLWNWCVLFGDFPIEEN